MKKRIISVLTALVMVFTLIPFTAFAADSNGTFTLKVYYHRDDNNYTDWNIWTWPWPEGTAERLGGKHDDFSNVNGEKCATLQVPADRDWLGFIVRKGYDVNAVWDEKDISFDQFFYIGFMEPNGTIEVDVRSGVPGYTIRSVTNPSTSGSSNGANLIYIRYEDKNTITAVFTKKPNSTPTFTDKNGNSLGATVTPVSDYVYTIKIPGNGLESGTECKLTADGKEYNLRTPDEGNYVDPNRLKVISAEFNDKNTVTAQFSGKVDDPKNQIHVFTPNGSPIGITKAEDLGGNKYKLTLSGDANPANEYFVDCNNSITPITGKDKLGGSGTAKPGSATHDGNKTITVKTTGKLDDPKGAISVSTTDGPVGVASVTPVSDTEYKVTLNDPIDPNKPYTVTINGATAPVTAEGGSASNAKPRTAQYNLYDTVYAGLSEKVANPDDLKNTMKISGPNGTVGITKVEAVPGRDKLYKITVASTLDRTKSYTLSNGGSTVSIRIGLIGDANEDGFVNAKDATAVLKHTVSLITLTNNNGEVNGDGVINQKDATQILKFVVNLPSTLDKYY